MKKRLSLILAVIMMATLICSVIPFSAAAAELPAAPEIAEGSADDIVAKIYTEDGQNLKQIKRSEFATTFANGSSIAQSAPYVGANYTVEILADINFGEEDAVKLRFNAAAGTTATIKSAKADGTHAVLYGTAGGDPMLRAGNAGTIVFEKVDIYVITGNLLQPYDGCVVDIVDCNWTSTQSGGDRGIRPSGSATVNVKGSSYLISKSPVFSDGWATDGSKTNTFTVETGATVAIAGGDTGKTAIQLAGPGTTVNINGGTVLGSITAVKGTVNLNAGLLNGNANIESAVAYTKADAFVIDASDVVITTPWEAPEGVPSVSGAATDVVAKVYVGSSTTAALEIKRSEYATKFVDGNNNVLLTDANLQNQDITIEFLADVDVGEVQTAFYVYPGKTVTVKGNNKVLLGYNNGNPVVRFRSQADGGNIEINDLTIFGARASCIQYYGNLIIDLNNTTVQSYNHTAIWPTGTGAYAVLNLNEGTTVKSGGCGINAAGTAGNQIFVNAGAKVISTGSAAIALGSAGDIYIKGEVINESENGLALNVKEAALGGFIEVDGGKIIGDCEIADLVFMDLKAGSIEGEFATQAEGDEYIKFYPGFVLNGVAFAGGSEETTTAPEETTTAPEGETTTTAPEGETTTTAPADDQTTVPAGDDVTTAGDGAAAGGCAGCNDAGAGAAIAIAVAMFAAAAIVIKKK